ncbi:porin family protein [Hymenobacter sp. HD11105]
MRADNILFEVLYACAFKHTCINTISLMKRLLLAVICGLLVETASAQMVNPDYVVTVKGDTLRGRIQVIGKRQNTIRLHRSGIAPMKFDAAQISSYGNASRPIRISREIGSGGPSQLLAPLVSGYISLYTSEDEQQEKQYYLQVADSTHVKAVKRATHQLTLAQTLPGCSTLDFGSNEIQSRYPYTSKGMTQLIMAYNKCRHPALPSTVIKRASGWHASFGLKGGVNTSSFNLTGTSYAGFGKQKQATGYQVGASVNFSTLSNFSLGLEANYMQLRSLYGPYELYYYNLGNPENTHTIQIDYSQIQVPLLLRYQVGRSMWRPYVNAGPSIGIKLHDSSVDTFTSASSDTKSEAIEVGKRSLGIAAGGGVSIHHHSLPILSVELRYDRMNQGVAHTNYAVHLRQQRSIRLDIGVTF